MNTEQSHQSFLAACRRISLLQYPEEIPAALEELRNGNPDVNAQGLALLTNVLLRPDYEGFQAEEALASIVLLAAPAPEVLKNEPGRDVVVARIKKYAELLKPCNRAGAALASSMISYLNDQDASFPALQAQTILHIPTSEYEMTPEQKVKSAALVETTEIRNAKAPMKRLVDNAGSVHKSSERIKNFSETLPSDLEEIIRYTKKWDSQPHEAETIFVKKDVIPLANILVKIMCNELKPDSLNTRCAPYRSKVIEAYACIFPLIAKYKKESWGQAQFEYNSRNGRLLLNIAQEQDTTPDRVAQNMMDMNVEQRATYLSEWLPAVQTTREKKIAAKNNDLAIESRDLATGFDERIARPSLAKKIDLLVKEYKRWIETPEAQGKINNVQEWPPTLQAALENARQAAKSNDALRGALSIAMRSNKLSTMAALTLSNTIERSNRRAVG